MKKSVKNKPIDLSAMVLVRVLIPFALNDKSYEIGDEIEMNRSVAESLGLSVEIDG